MGVWGLGPQNKRHATRSALSADKRRLSVGRVGLEPTAKGL